MASIKKLSSTSDTEYFIYIHSKAIKLSEMKKYIQTYGYSLIDSEELYNKASSDITNPTDISDNTIIADLSNNSYKNTSNSLPSTLANTIGDDETFMYALVIQESNDYYKLMGRKYELLKNNTMTAYNQETALKYIFYFFLIISLYTFSTNFAKLNLTHIIIYIFFIIYIFYHTSLSKYLLSNFKIAFYELKVAGTATQIITYLKIMFFILLTFFIPLIVFSAVSDQPFIPFMAATDNLNASEAIESVSNLAEESYDTVSDTVKNTSEAASEAVGNVTDSIVETTKSTTQQIGDTVNEATDNIKDSIAPKNTGPEKAGGNSKLKGKASPKGKATPKGKAKK